MYFVQAKVKSRKQNLLYIFVGHCIYPVFLWLVMYVQEVLVIFIH